MGTSLIYKIKGISEKKIKKNIFKVKFCMFPPEYQV